MVQHCCWSGSACLVILIAYKWQWADGRNSAFSDFLPRSLAFSHLPPLLGLGALSAFSEFLGGLDLAVSAKDFFFPLPFSAPLGVGGSAAGGGGACERGSDD